MFPGKVGRALNLNQIFMVITFESTHPGVREIGRHKQMSAASAALPTGAYTTFRTYEGNRVLRLVQHFRRLEESAGLMGQVGTINSQEAQTTVAQTLQHAQAEGWPTPDARFRLTFAPPRLFISIEPFEAYPISLYEIGVRCASVSLHRDNPHAKSTQFIASAAEAYKTLPEGIHEGLMIAQDGSILEGLSSNFFAICTDPATQKPALFTDEQHVLIGVTRSLVLEVAKSILPIQQTAITVNSLTQGQVRECFITSVSREILPVVQIDAIRIGDGAPGPITRTLIQSMTTLIQREAEPLYAN